jgi:arsenate reductase
MIQANQSDSKVHILFLCVANSARSQIAEGLAKKILGEGFWVESAGSSPSGVVQPMAIEVLREINIDISSHNSKSIKNLKPDFLEKLNFVVTLCEEEACPIINSSAAKLQWPLPDPAQVKESPDAKTILESYRAVRDRIEIKLKEFKSQL